MSTGHNSKIVGKVLKRFETLPSTNAYALQLLSQENVMEGTVFIASQQTHGRGQMGTNWVSESGKNIMLSVVLKPAFLPFSHQFYLNKAMSLAVHKTIANCLPDTSIKWPNDIYAGNRKIAGILIQTVVQGAAMKAAVVGIGINVNQVHFDEFAPNATSLALESGTELESSELEEQLFTHLDTFYSMLRHDMYAMDHLYQDVLYRHGERGLFQEIQSGREFVGVIENVDMAGKLMVREIDGEVGFFNLKELRFL